MDQQSISRGELADLIERHAASLVASLREPVADGDGPDVRVAPWVKVSEREEESYGWPEGIEHYSPFEIWESADLDGPVQIGLGRVTVPRVLYGSERYWWLAFEMIGDEKGRPIVVYNEADPRGDGENIDLIAVIKGKGHRGRSMFAPGDDLPDGYDDLPVDVFRSRISGPHAPNRLAVIASGGDRSVMLDHALLQLRLRP